MRTLPSLLFSLGVGLLITSQRLSASQENYPNGITLASTRIIYPGSAKNGVPFSITNNAEITYLMQSRVLPWGRGGHTKGSELSPFLILPPLQRLAPAEKMTLKIKLVNNQLPQDRESVFALMLKAIPAQETQDDDSRPSSTEGRLVIATQNQLKIFYRPMSLPDYDTEEISKKLVFIREEGQLVVDNPTPFYVTFATLSIGGGRDRCCYSKYYGGPLFQAALSIV